MKTVALVIALILLIGGGIPWLVSVILCPLYFKFGLFKWFYHDIMHWHQPDNSPERFDGLSTHSVCKYCGKDIMQDSQGNWFC